jgi:hypothetical protein
VVALAASLAVLSASCGRGQTAATPTADARTASSSVPARGPTPTTDATNIFGCPAIEVPGGPRLFSVPGDQWSTWKEEARSGDSSIASALGDLRHAADAALTQGPWSVVNSPSASPTGDKRTYNTLSRYWWPDPTKANGLPYVRKDGQTNPQVADYPDETFLNNTINNASTLAHAYSLLGDEKYAQRATLLINHFFTDPATGVLPDFTSAQFIPGRDSIGGDGILDSRGIIRVLDDVTFLRASSAWSSADDDAMRNWLSTLLQWLLDSPTGKAAAAAQNNHGTWYDDEVTALALFLGQTTVARTTVSNYVADRLNDQILPSGAQPLELARTNSWNYSTFNLVAATNLAITARYLGLDLYHCAGTDGSSIELATRFLIPYATGAMAWNYDQIGNFDASLASYPLNLAATIFDDAEARKALARVDPGPAGRGDGIDPFSLALFGHTQ